MSVALLNNFCQMTVGLRGGVQYHSKRKVRRDRHGGEQLLKSCPLRPLKLQSRPASERLPLAGIGFSLRMNGFFLRPRELHFLPSSASSPLGRPLRRVIHSLY